MGEKQEFITYKDAIEAALKEQFPSYNINVFAAIESDFKKPAIILSPPLKIPSPASSQNRFMLNCKVKAFVCHSLAEDKYGFEAQQVVVNLANFIRNNTWNKTASSPAVINGIQPAQLEGVEGVYSERIEFAQDIEIIDKN